MDLLGLNCRIPQQICMETLAKPTFCSPYAYTYVICVLLVRKSPKRISRTWTRPFAYVHSAVCSTRPKGNVGNGTVRTRRQENGDLRASAIVWNVGNVGTGGKKTETSRATCIVGNVGTVDKTLESYRRKRRKRWNRRQDPRELS